MFINLNDGGGHTLKIGDGVIGHMNRLFLFFCFTTQY